jgi:hypothetical protein
VSEQTVPIIERLRIHTMSHKCEENQSRNGIRTCNLAAGEAEVAFQARQILLLRHDFNPSVINIAQYLQHPFSNLPTMDRGRSMSVQTPSIPQYLATQVIAMTRKPPRLDCSDLLVPPTIPFSCRLPPRTARLQLQLAPHG